MRLHPLMLGLLLLAGCGESATETSANTQFAQPQDLAVFTPFARLDDRLADGLAFREQRLDHLEINEAFRGDISTEELTTMLQANQQQVIRVARASWLLRPPLPPEPEYTEQDIRASRHLDGVRARLINNCRLLDADAIRCWSNENYDGCVWRLGASIRIGLCMWADSEEEVRYAGASAIVQALLELDGRVADGLAERVSDELTAETAQLVAAIDLSAMPGWRDDGDEARALARMRAAFPLPDGP